MSVNSTNSTRTDWLLFVALSFMWGSSYLFIKIGVESGLEPFTLIMLRLFFGALLIGSVVVATRERLPRTLPEYVKLAILAFFGIALPFSLITLAEQRPDIQSALASVLTAPTPLFVVPFAAILLTDERLSVNKFLGIVIGLAGVAILVGFDPAQIGRGEFTGELMLIAACVSYAFAGVYARRFIVGYGPMIPPLFEVGLALVMIAAVAFVFENPLARITVMPLKAWFAVIWLGIIGSGLAFMVFFRLIRNWGATRTAMVAYVMPIWGIILGAVVLGEAIGLDRLSGTALVIAGIALVNVKRESIAGALSNLRGSQPVSAEATAEVVTEQR